MPSVPLKCCLHCEMASRVRTVWLRLKGAANRLGGLGHTAVLARGGCCLSHQADFHVHRLRFMQPLPCLIFLASKPGHCTLPDQLTHIRLKSTTRQLLASSLPARGEARPLHTSTAGARCACGAHGRPWPAEPSRPPGACMATRWPRSAAAVSSPARSPPPQRATGCSCTPLGSGRITPFPSILPPQLCLPVAGSRRQQVRAAPPAASPGESRTGPARGRPGPAPGRPRCQPGML